MISLKVGNVDLEGQTLVQVGRGALAAGDLSVDWQMLVSYLLTVNWQKEKKKIIVVCGKFESVIGLKINLLVCDTSTFA